MGLFAADRVVGFGEDVVGGGEEEGVVGVVQVRHVPCHSGCHDVRFR